VCLKKEGFISGIECRDVTPKSEGTSRSQVDYEKIVITPTLLSWHLPNTLHGEYYLWRTSQRVYLHPEVFHCFLYQLHPVY